MNISLKVVNHTKEVFAEAFGLISLDEKVYVKGKNESVFKCDGYVIKDNQLYLSKYSDKAIKFPYDFNLEQTIEFAFGWFKSVEPLGIEPDTNGSTKIGYLISTDVGYDDCGLFALVKPIWLIYGK